MEDKNTLRNAQSEKKELSVSATTKCKCLLKNKISERRIIYWVLAMFVKNAHIK